MENFIVDLRFSDISVTEVAAIKLAVDILVHTALKCSLVREVCIHSYSRAAILTLKSMTVRSKLVRECKLNRNRFFQLVTLNKVILVAIVGVLTRHCPIGSLQNCMEEGKVESSYHFLLYLSAFVRLRLNYLGRHTERYTWE